jgi:hypothetical protein
MMPEVRLYCRIGKGRGGVRADANTSRPNPAALTETVRGSVKVLPTINVTLVLDLPPGAFDLAERCLVEAEIPLERIAVAADVSGVE